MSNCIVKLNDSFSIPSTSVGLIILAAGASTRMGHPKQLLPYRNDSRGKLQSNRSLLQHTAEVAIASGCHPIVIVLGAHSAQIRAASGVEKLPVQLVENPDWEQGMGGSIRVGLARLQAQYSAIEAVVLTLCDQPLISSKVIQQLVTTFHGSHLPIVASEYTGTVGVPALFSRSLFPELLALKSSAGAKQVIQSHLLETARVAFPGGAIDLDTQHDYDQFLQNTCEGGDPGICDRFS